MKITNTQDIIDGRDIIDRIEELEAEKDELEALLAVVSQTDCYDELKYGKILINENYFTKHCQKLCEDNGDIPPNLPWHIAENIDWNGVADDIKHVHVKIYFGGVIYFMFGGTR